jgi:hypothetical protein
MYWDGTMKSRRAAIQIAKARDAEGLEIGETATITITGTVKSIESPREAVEYGPGGGKSRMVPGSIELEIDSIAVQSGEDNDDV